MNYQDYGFTMHYECTATFPDGTTQNFVQKRVVENEKQAQTLIAEWNRLSTITNGIKWNFRRLS